MQKPSDFIKKIVISREEIEKRCQELGSWVNETYANSSDLVLVGLLKGSVPFLAQLIKEISLPITLDFMTISSYEGSTSSTGNVKVIMDLASDILNKDVLIVEDILDTGRTLSKTVCLLKERLPKSIKVITLVDKPQNRVVPFEADQVGFVLGKEFLCGFGLDVKEKFRNLPYIAIFDESKLDYL